MYVHAKRGNGTDIEFGDLLGAAIGQNGVHFINDTNLHTFDFQVIYPLTDTIFETLTEDEATLNGVAAPDRASVYGGVKASQTLTVAVNPTAADTMTIDETEYTFVAEEDFDTAGEIAIGEDVATTQANIVAAIMGTDEVNEAHESVTIGDFATNVATVTAKLKGTSENSIATTETFTSESNVFGGETLEDGANATAITAKTDIQYGQFTSVRLVSGSIACY